MVQFEERFTNHKNQIEEKLQFVFSNVMEEFEGGSDEGSDDEG